MGDPLTLSKKNGMISGRKSEKKDTEEQKKERI